MLTANIASYKMEEQILIDANNNLVTAQYIRSTILSLFEKLKKKL